MALKFMDLSLFGAEQGTTVTSRPPWREGVRLWAGTFGPVRESSFAPVNLQILLRFHQGTKATSFALPCIALETVKTVSRLYRGKV